MKTGKAVNKSTSTFLEDSFSNELHSILQGHSLYINRESMDMKKLKFLVKGFKMENELLKPFDDAIETATSRMEKKRHQERDEAREDAEIIEDMTWKKLEDSYRYYIKL